MNLIFIDSSDWFLCLILQQNQRPLPYIYALRRSVLALGVWEELRNQGRTINVVSRSVGILRDRGIPSLWLVTVFLGLESSTSLWKITYPKFLRYSKITRILVSRKVEQPCFFLHFFPDFLTFFIWWFLKVLPLLFEKKIWQTLCVKLKGTLLQLALKPSWLLNSKT